MKTVLCFGDSNTWGAVPLGVRYSMDERWTGILRKELGDEFHIIEEGLNGRTTVWEDPIEEYKSGKEQIIPIVYSHMPVDLVIIMLGTNDLKKRFSVQACDIAEGAGVLVNMMLKSSAGPNWGPCQVLLVAPAPVYETGGFAEAFEGAEKKSQKFGEYYENIAKRFGCHFLDAGKVVVSSKRDGIHLEASEHLKLGKAVAQKVKDIFSL